MDLLEQPIKPAVEAASLAPLLITGAPRSGASVIAQAMAAGGVFLGDRFGNSDNRNGLDNWCDRELSGFHEGQLSAGPPGRRPDGSAEWFPPPVTQFSASPDSLLSKFSGREPWGWKDSRAVWFLDAWNRVLPDAHWICVVRRPAEIAWAEAAARTHRNSSRWRVARRALALWLECNHRVLDFAGRHPGRVTALFLPDDIERAMDRVSERMPAAWRDALSGVRLVDHFNPYLLRANVPAWVRAQVRAERSVERTWRELQALRPGPRDRAERFRSRPTAPGGKRRIAVASRTRVAYSETFIQSHIRDLPAHVDWFLVTAAGRAMTNDELPLCSIRERALSGLYEAFGSRPERYTVKAIGRFLKRRRIEAVLAEFGTVSAKVMDACVEQGVPLIAHFHGYDVSRRSILAEYRQEYERLFEIAHSLVVVSHDMAAQLQALGAPPEKIAYNPCSVDMTAFGGASPGSAPPIFLTTGRHVDKKGPHLTLLAFARVLAACPEARLVMVGDGPLKPVCLDLAQALGIAGAVRFLGFLPHFSIASLMRTMRGFVQHSVTASDGNAEGTPVAVMEAAASGLPVIGTAHAGIKEAIRHGETGYLVEPGDVEAMAAHWTELARDPALAQHLGQNARAFVADSPFERSRSIQHLWRIIEGAIRKS